MRELNETLGSVEALVEADVTRALAELQGRLERGEIGEIGFGEDQKALREDAETKVRNLREAFRVASKGDIQERVCFFFSNLFWSGGLFIDRTRLFLTISLMASHLRSCMIRLLHRQGSVSIDWASLSMLRSRASIL